MARVLGIDWDHNYLRLVEASVQGGKTAIQRAWVWQEDVCPNPAQAEEAGQRLKERLREVGVAPAPVRFVVGRDAIICRDVLYPDVPKDEVAAVVNFQAAKELSIPPDEAVVDYLVSRVPGPLGEKRAAALILHKELLTAVQKTCQVAGLKLDCVSPSSVGHIANRETQPGMATTDTVGLLVLANGGGELTLLREGRMLFSRTLNGSGRGNGDATHLLPELRRTLAAFDSQYPQCPVRSLSVTGCGTSAEQEQFATTLRMPVTAYEVLPATALREVPPTQRGLLAGAIGLVQARKPLPVDFLHPKRVQPPPSRKPYYYLAGAAAAILLLVSLILSWMEMARRRTELEDLQAKKALTANRIKLLGDVDKRLEAISTWSNSELVLLDELYELIARFPDQPGLRITKVSWKHLQPATTNPAGIGKTAIGRMPAAVKQPAKPVLKPVAELTIQATGDGGPLEELREALGKADHWKLDQWSKDVPTTGSYQAKLLVYRLTPEEYDTLLGAAKHVTIGMSAAEKGDRP